MNFPTLHQSRPPRRADHRANRPSGGRALLAIAALAFLPLWSDLAAATAERSFLSAAPQMVRGNGNECTGGIQADDGSVEGAAGWSNSTTNGTYVMQFDLPSVPTRLDAVCLCFTRTEFSNTDDLDFNLVVYGAGGPNGAPGPQLARIAARAVNVPDFFAGGVAMYRFDLGASAPDLLARRVYVGAQWVPFDYRQFFLCSDASPGTPLSEGWTSGDGGANWERMSVVRPTYRAFFIRLFGSPATITGVPLPWVALVLLFALPYLAWRRLRRRPIRQASDRGSARIEADQRG